MRKMEIWKHWTHRPGMTMKSQNLTMTPKLNPRKQLKENNNNNKKKENWETNCGGKVGNT